MNDLEEYIEKRKRKDSEFAKMIKTQKTAISRIENHAEDIKLSTIQKVAKALGKNLEIALR